MKRQLFALAVLSLMLAGCSEKVETRDFRNPACVLVTVGDDQLTRQDLNEYLDLATDMRQLMTPGMSKQDGLLMKRQLISVGINGWIEQRLLKHEADRRKIRVSDAECNAAMADFSRMMTSNKAIAARFTSARVDKLREQFRTELLSAKVKKAFVGDVGEVTEEEIARRYQEIDNYNRVAQATNDFVYATATNVWNQLCGGANFVEMVKKYSQSYDLDDGIWGTFGYNDLKKQGDDLANAVAALKVGDFTAPTEGDGGLMILTLLEMSEAADGGVNKVANAPVVSRNNLYKLRRIYFKLPVLFQIPEKDHLVKVLKEIRENERLKAAMDKLRKSESITMPAHPEIVRVLTEDILPSMPSRMMPGGKKSLKKPVLPQ